MLLTGLGFKLDLDLELRLFIFKKDLEISCFEGLEGTSES